jgi:hypothetical protein
MSKRISEALYESGLHLHLKVIEEVSVILQTADLDNLDGMGEKASLYSYGQFCMETIRKTFELIQDVETEQSRELKQIYSNLPKEVEPVDHPRPVAMVVQHPDGKVELHAVEDRLQGKLDVQLKVEEVQS